MTQVSFKLSFRLYNHQENQLKKVIRGVKTFFSVYKIYFIKILQLRIAALNDPWSGDMHGVRGADYACYRLINIRVIAQVQYILRALIVNYLLFSVKPETPIYKVL